MMCGSSTAAAARDSAMNRRRNAGSDARPGARIFSATGRPSRSSRARKTTAMPPAPTCASSRYPATTEPGRNQASCAGRSSLNFPPQPPPRCPVRSGGYRQCAAQTVQVSGLLTCLATRGVRGSADKPEVDAAVKVARGQGGTIGAEGDRAYAPAAWVGERRGPGSGGDIPQEGAAVSIASGESRAIRAERDRVHARTAGVGQGRGQLPVGDIPQEDLAGYVGSGQHCAIRAERNRVYWAAMGSAEGRRQEYRGGLPIKYEDAAIDVGAGDRRAVGADGDRIYTLVIIYDSEEGGRRSLSGIPDRDVG